MAVFKCKMCGASLDITDLQNKVVKCEYCGTSQTTPTFDDDRKVNLFLRADKLRKSSDFDKAAGVYESIAGEFPEESEAYWGLCLCKYGIEYVDDPATGKKIPTCHRTSFDSIFEDQNFEQAIENADEEAGRVMRSEAKVIDKLQQSILETVNREAPYDIFICYKETDSEGGRTLDSVMAQDIYDALTDKGFRVFFSRITLESKLGELYEPYIFAALNSAKVMIVVGTSYENFNAVWVKNEWSRFLHMMEKDKTKILIPCYKDIDAYDMPKEFKKLQAQDMGKIGYLQDLVRGVQKLIGTGAPSAGAAISGGSLATVGSLLKRAEIYLSDKDWHNTDICCEKVLDADPTNKDAYMMKMLASIKCENMSRLGESSAFYRSITLLKSEKAYRYADDSVKSELESLHKMSHDKFNEETYNEAFTIMNEAHTEKSFAAAMGLFGEIKDYKDSVVLSELCKCRISCIKREEQIAEAESEHTRLSKEATDRKRGYHAAKRVFIFDSHGITTILGAAVFLVMMWAYYFKPFGGYNSNMTLVVVSFLLYIGIVLVGFFRAIEFIDSGIIKGVIDVVANTATASAAFYIAGIVRIIMHLVERSKDIKYNRELMESAERASAEQGQKLEKMNAALNDVQNRIRDLEAKHRSSEQEAVAVGV